MHSLLKFIGQRKSCTYSLLNDERLESIEDFRIKERKYINRVRACLNASIGNAVTNAEKCNVFYKADTTLTSFLQPASPPD